MSNSVTASPRPAAGRQAEVLSLDLDVAEGVVSTARVLLALIRGRHRVIRMSYESRLGAGASLRVELAAEGREGQLVQQLSRIVSVTEVVCTASTDTTPSDALRP